VELVTLGVAPTKPFVVAGMISGMLLCKCFFSSLFQLMDKN